MVYLKNLTIFRVRDCVWGFPEIFLVVSVQCLLPETVPEAQEFSPFFWPRLLPSLSHSHVTAEKSVPNGE